MRLMIAAVVLLLLPLPAAAQPPDTARVRDAAIRGYAAIQTAQKVSRSSQTCTATCHLQAYGAFAYRAMRDHALPLDEAVALADAQRGFRRHVTSLTAAIEGNSLGEIAMNEAFFLVSAHALGARPSVVTAAAARAVALKTERRRRLAGAA